MRRLIIILSVACVFILGVFIFVKPVIVTLARRQLANIFIQSQVSIGECAFEPLRRISFFDIEIKRQGAYDIKVKEAAIQYNLFSIFKASPLKLSLKGSKVYLSIPKRQIRELVSYLNLGRGAPIFRSVEVSDLILDLNTLDLTLKATLSSGVNVTKQSVDYLDFKIDIFKMFGVQLENLFLRLGPGSEQGDFSIAQMKYDKLKVSDTKGKVRLEGKALSLYGVSARILNGDMGADMNVKIDKKVHYLVNLKCTGLDIETFVRNFNFQEKFNMTGRLSGDLKLKGNGEQIEILQGSFLTLSPGGTLVITDTKFLEHMAYNTQQPLDLLVESFKNYHYNTGLMSLGFENGNVILKIELEGEAGKRNLNVILHDFSVGKEGK